MHNNIKNDVLCLTTAELNNSLREVKDYLDFNMIFSHDFKKDLTLSKFNAKKFEDVVEFSKKINKLIVITRGEKGALAIKDTEVKECAAKKNLKIIDLTGAGDLFAGGFLHGYINGKTLGENLEKGTEMSSKIIQKIGARLN